MELNWIYEILDNGITLEDYDTTAKECAVVDGNDHEGEIKLLGKISVWRHTRIREI